MLSLDSSGDRSFSFGIYQLLTTNSPQIGMFDASKSPALTITNGTIMQWRGGLEPFGTIRRHDPPNPKDLSLLVDCHNPISLASPELSPDMEVLHWNYVGSR